MQNLQLTHGKKTLCPRYNKTQCTNASCKFEHRCAIRMPNGQACGGQHPAHKHRFKPAKAGWDVCRDTLSAAAIPRQTSSSLQQQGTALQTDKDFLAQALLASCHKKKDCKKLFNGEARCNLSFLANASKNDHNAGLKCVSIALRALKHVSRCGAAHFPPKWHSSPLPGGFVETRCCVSASFFESFSFSQAPSACQYRKTRHVKLGSPRIQNSVNKTVPFKLHCMHRRRKPCNLAAVDIALLLAPGDEKQPRNPAG